MIELTAVAKVLLFTGAAVAVGEAMLPPRVCACCRTPRGRSLVRTGAVVALLLAPLLWLQAQRAALELPWADVSALLNGGWGRNWTKLLAACLVTAAALPRRFGKFSSPVLWAGVVALAIAIGGLGHANAGDFVIASRAIDAIHVLTMGAWIGSLVLAIADGPSDDIVARWRRMSAIATIAAPLAVVTGVMSSLRLLGASTPRAVIASPYGQMLLAKTVLVLCILTLGALQRRNVHAVGVPSSRAVRLEVMLAAVVMLLTAVLTGSEPPE
ncbi:MAG TPA: CopD family protein [Gemmatimonas sp.]|uniref:copper resistance D family protein n=1 Tax=Gemmatimonas sp. TaxID=1962908 RepID=UPI002EDB37B3